MDNVIRPQSMAIGHRADPHRHESRTLLRVKVRPRSYLLGECMCKQGENLVEVPASIVSTAHALVEDTAKLEAASVAYTNARDAWGRSNPGEPFMGSIGASFRSIYFRDPLPLDSCEVVEEGLPAVLTAEDRRVAAVVSNITTQVGSEPTRRGKRGNQ